MKAVQRFLTLVLLVALTSASGISINQASALTTGRSGLERHNLLDHRLAEQGEHTAALSANTSPATSTVPVSASGWGTLPLSFVWNGGQADAAVRFEVHGMGGRVFFTSGEVVLLLPTLTEPHSTPLESEDEFEGAWAAPSSVPDMAVVRLRFEGANPTPEVTGTERLPGIVNYFIGNDPTKWRTDLPTYAGIVYRELYPGIDLLYGGTQGLLKGTYTVAPGADPGMIRWRYEGAMDMRVEEATGDLVVRLPASVGTCGESCILTERAPTAWQEIAGERVPVSVHYAVGEDSNVGFALDAYDPAYPLTLDPTLNYSTYLGGSDRDEASDITVKQDGTSVTVVGTTWSTDFPVRNPYDGTLNAPDLFVTKFDSAGRALVFSTYLGGSGSDGGGVIALDNSSSVYVAGFTYSTDFPTTQGALDRTLGGTQDAFVTKLSAAGNALVYSTYLGGSDVENCFGIAVDNSGNAYIAGTTRSTDFTTKNPLSENLRGYSDAFVTKLNAAGNGLVYSTYLGGDDIDPAHGGIAVDGSGYAYVAGITWSEDFPTTEGAPDRTLGGRQDAYAVKLSQAGNGLEFGTFLGGSDTESCNDIAVSQSGGTVYVTGSTYSSDFPTTQGALDSTLGGPEDGFVVALSGTSSSLVYSTYLGGSGWDGGEAVAVDGANSAYVTGYTYSADFPITPDSLDATLGGNSDAFVVRLKADGSRALYSTYLGGSDDDEGSAIAVDEWFSVYVTGWTESTDFPVQLFAFQRFKAGPSDCGMYDLSCRDAFVTSIQFDSPLVHIIVNTNDSIIDPNDGRCSLTEAITAANTDTASGNAVGECAAGFGADTILLQAPAPLYQLTAGLPSVTSEITIISQAGAQRSSIERSHEPDTPPFSIFHVAATGNLTLEGVVIGNGLAGAGGGINNDGTVTLKDCQIIGNKVDLWDGRGGGIYNGGGICPHAMVTLINSAILANEAGEGGGIYIPYSDCGGSEVKLINSTVRGNRAFWRGGGIYNGNGGVVELTNSTISNNSAEWVSGGGIFNNCALYLTNSTISGNSANGTRSDGGGIYNSGGCYDQGCCLGHARLENSTVSGNFARRNGGGIYNEAGDAKYPPGNLLLENCTVSNNEAESGSGIFNGMNIYNPGKASLWNTIAANQISGDDCFGPITSKGFNLDSDGSCGLGATGDLTADPKLGPLQDNGGPTKTHSLFASSPAIDAIPLGVPCPSTDQRGARRPVDGNDDGIVACDIGSFEYQKPTAVTLTSFAAAANRDHVTLTWETASEVDNEGFSLWRSEAVVGGYIKINATLIPAQGDADTGASYTYTDADVTRGTLYYYQLEDVDIHGVSAFHGPVWAMPGERRVYLPLVLK